MRRGSLREPERLELVRERAHERACIPAFERRQVHHRELRRPGAGRCPPPTRARSRRCAACRARSASSAVGGEAAGHTRGPRARASPRGAACRRRSRVRRDRAPRPRRRAARRDAWLRRADAARGARAGGARCRGADRASGSVGMPGDAPATSSVPPTSAVAPGPASDLHDVERRPRRSVSAAAAPASPAPITATVTAGSPRSRPSMPKLTCAVDLHGGHLRSGQHGCDHAPALRGSSATSRIARAASQPSSSASTPAALAAQPAP